MNSTVSGHQSPYSFRWLASEPIPAKFDLSRGGWAASPCGEISAECIGIFPAEAPDSKRLDLLALHENARQFVIVVGVGTPPERTALLQLGFGEVVSAAIEPGEFQARAARLAGLKRWLPRYRRVGALELDLLARDAYAFDKPLNLNPREFALIWRLADTPGQPVSKESLIQDVWRLGFMPETNSIAVHMSRLRRKLAFVDLAGVVATASTGGYCLLETCPPQAPLDKTLNRAGSAPVPEAYRQSDRKGLLRVG